MSVPTRDHVNRAVSEVLKAGLYQIVDAKKRICHVTFRREEMRAEARRGLPKHRPAKRLDLPGKRRNDFVTEGEGDKLSDDYITGLLISFLESGMRAERFVVAVAGLFDSNRQSIFQRKAILDVRT